MSAHRPGAISALFIHMSGVFAAGFWTWLAILAVTGRQVTGWHVVAAAGATTTTLASVVLGVRYAMQRNAATRHEEIMRTLTEISWYSFAGAARAGVTDIPAPRSADAGSAPVPPTAAPHQSGGQDADVIHLDGESRHHPRR